MCMGVCVCFLMSKYTALCFTKFTDRWLGRDIDTDINFYKHLYVFNSHQKYANSWFNFSQLKARKVLQKMKLTCIFYLPLLTYTCLHFLRQEDDPFCFWMPAFTYSFTYLSILITYFNIKDQGSLWQYSRMGSVM